MPGDEDVLTYARRLVPSAACAGGQEHFAVDLAKLSLWLVRWPRSILHVSRHALRHGDSLVGLSRAHLLFQLGAEATAACGHSSTRRRRRRLREQIQTRVIRRFRREESYGEADGLPSAANGDWLRVLRAEKPKGGERCGLPTRGRFRLAVGGDPRPDIDFGELRGAAPCLFTGT